MSERFEFLVKFLCGEGPSPEGRAFADMNELAINSRPRVRYWWRAYVRQLAMVHRDEIAEAAEEREKLVAEVERLLKRERDAEELIRTLAGIANSVDVSAERKMWPVDDDDPAYWQTEQWCKWVEQQEEEAASWLFAYQPERKEEG